MIQIQHLLKLNIFIFASFILIFLIQIQHLLKLNYKDLTNNKYCVNSNTTFVKVKC